MTLERKLILYAVVSGLEWLRVSIQNFLVLKKGKKNIHACGSMIWLDMENISWKKSSLW